MKKPMLLVIIMVGLVSAGLVQANDKQYLIDFVVLNDGKTRADRAEYERRTSSAIRKAGFKRVQSYKLDSFMGGQLKGASILNLYTMDPDGFDKLGASESYKKHIPFRNEVNDMGKLTLYVGEALLNSGQLNNQPLLIDLVVMRQGYGHVERFDYESNVRKIAKKHGLQLKNSFDIDRKLGGVGPGSALKLNIWTMASEGAMQALGSDPEYQKLIKHRNEIHDMGSLSLYIGSPNR